MDPIGNANRIAMLLRQRLLERANADARGKTVRASEKHILARPGGIRSVEAIVGLDDRRLKRALIESILADQFGNDLINVAKFQEMVDQVAETISADAQGAVIFAEAVNDLRK